MVNINRKQQILESTKDVFAQEGFFGSSSKELAKAAKISEPLLYKYFPSKEILFRACVEESLSPFSRPDCYCEGETNFFRKITEAFSKIDNRTLKLLLFAYLELDQSYLLELITSYEKEIGTFVNKKQREKTLRKLKGFERILTSTLFGLNLLHVQEASEMIDDVADLMLNGLRQN